MTKKAKIINSIESIYELLDREEVSYGEVRPFAKFELARIAKMVESLPFAEDLKGLVNGAISYSQNRDALSFALDELLIAVDCL